MSEKRFSRRDFVKSVGAAAELALTGCGSLALGSGPARPTGASPSDRIVLGMIGVGGMSLDHEREAIVGHEPASLLLDRPARHPWTL